VRNSTFLDNRPSSYRQRTRGTLPPDTENSYHVPRRPTLDKGTSPRRSRNPHIFQSRSTNVSSRPRVRRTSKDPRRTTDAYRTSCGTNAHHHNCASSWPASGQFQQHAISVQVPSYTRISSTAHTLSSDRTQLVGPSSLLTAGAARPGLVSERQNAKTPRAWQAHRRVCRQGQAFLHIQRGRLRTYYLQTCDHRKPSHSTF
jgi:hypothetical protein